MSALIGALKSFFQVVTLLLTLARDNQLRREGERKARMEDLEKAYEQQGVAHEIDLKVAHGELSAADLERMRKYQRP